MKKVIAVILCTAVLSATVRADYPDAPVKAALFIYDGPQQNVTLAEGFVALLIAGFGWYAYWKIKGLSPSQTRMEYFVLLESLDGRGSWQPIMTNGVVLNGTNAVDLFAFAMTNSMALYKVKWLKGYRPPSLLQVELVP